MKICVAQIKPVKGDIARNIRQHQKLLDLALANGAGTVIFPELSVTGYEPTLAAELATTPHDRRFAVFQEISNTRQVTIGVGVPTKHTGGTGISMVLFRPHQARQIYGKQYLHADEEPFFISGKSSVDLIGDKVNTALAICYEISIPEHAENAYKNGAEIYIASVAKSVGGMDAALARLAQVARTYAMTVFMANCVGFCDNFVCGGKTSVWDNQGNLVGQLNAQDEGILIFDTDTREVIRKEI